MSIFRINGGGVSGGALLECALARQIGPTHAFAAAGALCVAGALALRGLLLRRA